MTGQKLQGHLVSARFHLRKKIIIHLPSVPETVTLGSWASAATSQILLGGIPFKTIDPG